MAPGEEAVRTPDNNGINGALSYTISYLPTTSQVEGKSMFTTYLMKFDAFCWMIFSRHRSWRLQLELPPTLPPNIDLRLIQTIKQLIGPYNRPTR